MKRSGKLLLLVVMITSIFMLENTVSVVMADDIITESYYYSPIVLTANLTVDGSITPVTFSVLSDDNNIDYVTKIIYHMHWRDNVIDYDNFGTGSALINGSQMIYDGIVLVTVQTIHDMGLSEELRIDRDDKNPKDNHLVVALEFRDFVSVKGLKIKNGHNLTFVVRDNLTSRIDDLTLIIEGYKLIIKEVEFNTAFTEEMLVIDNIWELLAFPLFIPLTLIFTWEPNLVLLGMGILLIEVSVIWLLIIRRD